jgi:hypothetical protein
MQVYVLDQSIDGKTINVVFHFPIPSANNQAGVNYQTALVDFLGGSSNIKSAVPGSPDLAAMQAGSIFEYMTTHRWSVLGLTPAQMLSELQALYSTVETAILAQLQAQLIYYGYMQ